MAITCNYSVSNNVQGPSPNWISDVIAWGNNGGKLRRTNTIAYFLSAACFTTSSCRWWFCKVIIQDFIVVSMKQIQSTIQKLQGLTCHNNLILAKKAGVWRPHRTLASTPSRAPYLFCKCPLILLLLQWIFFFNKSIY